MHTYIRPPCLQGTGRVRLLLDSCFLRCRPACGGSFHEQLSSGVVHPLGFTFFVSPFTLHRPPLPPFTSTCHPLRCRPACGGCFYEELPAGVVHPLGVTFLFHLSPFTVHLFRFTFHPSLSPTLPPFTFTCHPLRYRVGAASTNNCQPEWFILWVAPFCFTCHPSPCPPSPLSPLLVTLSGLAAGSSFGCHLSVSPFTLHRLPVLHVGAASTNNCHPEWFIL